MNSEKGSKYIILCTRTQVIIIIALLLSLLRTLRKQKLKKITPKQAEAYFLHQLCNETNTGMASQY